MQRYLFVFLLAITATLYGQTVSGGGTGSGSGGAGGQYSTAAAIYSIGTVYFPPGGGLAANATETNVDGVVGTAGTISNFTVSLSAAVGTGSTAIFTWRKNASD